MDEEFAAQPDDNVLCGEAEGRNDLLRPGLADLQSVPSSASQRRRDERVVADKAVGRPLGLVRVERDMVLSMAEEV